MNTTFNSALKQSTAIRKDLSALTNHASSSYAGSDDFQTGSALTPAALGSLSASLTAFSRTLDEYNNLAKQELNPEKQSKAFERIRNFRSELQEFRSQFDRLKSARDDVVQTQNRAELLGRRPFVSNTPENPYANAAAASRSNSGGGLTSTVGRYGISSTASIGGGGGGGEMSREAHVMREQDFFRNTHSTLDEYIMRGQAALENLGTQKETLKDAQRRLYSVANTLGLSGDTIRMVNRRARQDKWIFWGGVLVFFAFCWLVLHYLR